MGITRVPLILIAIVGGCFEKPIVHVDKAGGPIAMPDASDDGRIDPEAACLACMTAPDEPGPGCQTVFDACKQNEKCSGFVDCGFELKCFTGSKREVLKCGEPCVARGGPLTPDNPAFLLVANFFQCTAYGPCGDICFQSE
jgi:hypothetical protein